ncbi:mammalian cell entry protein [Mycolicibacterium acapulense]|nr:mammalian cell entry protein [Mycolicibacterium acapulense]KUI15199.1 mammalian cell entry protein [Mycolicibacterium acapulense]
MEDQPADSGDLTTDSSAESTPAPRRRRWFFGRRKTEGPAAAADTEATEEAQEAEPSAPRPVGKAKRRGRARVDDGGTEIATEEAKPQVTEPESPAADDVAEEPGAADESEVTPQDVRFAPHRSAGKRLIAAIVAAAALFVGATAFAAATLQPYLSERAEIDTKLDVARTAASAISTLWTYTPDNMDQLPDRSAAFLGGDFAYEYRKYIDAIVATNKQAQVTNTTQVMGAAVETLTPDEATAIVYTNSVATSPMSKNIPSLRYLSYRLTMERRDAKWLITNMSTITSLDLTPQL